MSELTYERAKQLYTPYDEGQMRHLCALRDVEIDRLQDENAKLRELVRRLISHVEHPPCEGCGFEMNCDGEHVTQCDEWLFMIADARKLGVEVD